MKNIKLVLFFCIAVLFVKTQAFSQANPSIAVLPLNAGLVSLGSNLDLQVTVGNTGIVNIPAFKLRPVITVPNIVNILPDAQQTGLPPGWSIVTNSGSQIRICNGTDVIGGSSSRTIFIKVQGVSIGGPSTFAGQMNFANGVSCASPGPAPNGNITADDNSTSTLQVVAGCSLGISAVAGTISCNAGTTTITASATAATGPVEYSITGGAGFQAGNTFNNVVAGTYTVTVREVNNPSTCVASIVLNVTEPAPIAAPSVNIVQPTCTVSNGTITITSALTGLNFSVDGAPFSAYPAGGYLLPAGSHTITAENSNNCSSATTTFIVNAQPPSPLTPAIGTVTQPDCNVSTGLVVVNNLPAGAWVIEPGNIAGNTGSTVINNLAAGSYSFTVTNAAGCSSPPSATVTIIAVAGAPGAPVVSITQPSCTTATGTITVTSPVAAFTFSLDAAPFAPYPAGGYTGIAAGTHTITAQNSSGCLSPVTSITINAQPASPAAPTVTIQQPTCTVSTGNIMVSSDTAGFTFSLDGSAFAPYPVAGYTTATGTHSLAVQNSSGCAPNITSNIVINAQPATPVLSHTATPVTCFAGSSTITATASGGLMPYEYNVNAGTFQTSNIFTLGAGTHAISVRDANGCIAGNSNIIITEPTAITAVASAAPILCNGGNAILTILATGGLGAYEYSLNNGPYQTGNLFNVAAGTYTAHVRLINNPACSSSVNTILNVTQPAVLKASATAKAIEYCGGNTVANVLATGGTAPYTGIGNFAKGPGNWNFIIVDSNGCSSSADLYIFPPGCVDLKVFPNPAQSHITVNHSAAVGTSSWLQIFSANGVKCFTHYVPEHSFISTLNISGLANGNYIMVYVNGNEKKETRFVKINK